jgi:hypothetical protein
MEHTNKEPEVSAAGPAKVETMPGNGSGNGFVPLVTVVGFHHAR